MAWVIAYEAGWPDKEGTAKLSGMRYGIAGYIRGGVFNEVTYTSPAILAQI